jgi:putative LysE/RhtB family amino acid efflux pump
VTLALFAKSLALGLAVAAPLGPIGALCVNRTLERGFRAGVAGGFGTALADAVYAVAAATGFAVFAAGLARIDPMLRIGGGAFMLWLGWRSLAPRAPARAAARGGGAVGTALATFLLTLANPMTALTFAALFAGMGLAAAPGGEAVVVAGVFLGSMLWWVALSGGVALAREQLPAGFARWTALASGGLLILFGLGAIGSALAGPLGFG